MEQATSKVKKNSEAMSGSTMKLPDYTKKKHDTQLTNSMEQSSREPGSHSPCQVILCLL